MARKRQNGEGSVFFRADKNKWVGEITIGKTANGKQKKKSFYGDTSWCYF